MELNGFGLMLRTDQPTKQREPESLKVAGDGEQHVFIPRVQGCWLLYVGFSMGTVAPLEVAQS